MKSRVPGLITDSWRMRAARSLCPGTIIGKGTVSNDNYRQVGSSCISERCGNEMVDAGEPVTPFMSLGDSIDMEARHKNGNAFFRHSAIRYRFRSD